MKVVFPQTGISALGLSVMAGLAQAVSMASIVDGQPRWWLQLVALGSLALLLDRCKSGKSAALLGWLFALSWLSGTFWWLFISLHTFGGLPAWMAVLSVLALAAVLAVYYALACYLYVAVRPANSAWAALLFAALWLLAEMARGVWLTGFGWGGSGYAHGNGPLAAYLPWLGVYGVGAVAAWGGMALVQLGAGGCRPLLGVLVVLALPWAWQASGLTWSHSAGRLQVALLQGNIAQSEKFQPASGVPLALNWYAEQLGRNQAALVIAPETALPLLPKQLPESYWDALRQRFGQGEQAALIGMPLGDYRAGYSNSVIGLRPGTPEVWRYDKHHLVPFGEFIPPFFKWFTELMNIPLGDFNRGAIGQAALEWGGQRVGVHICYEDLFGEELGARFVKPDLAPTLFANVSNIAWFGNSVAIDQHLQISRVRALEFERPFVRATNTGATVIIDHMGRVTAELPRYTQGVLTGEVEGRTGITPYAWWVSRFGLWPLWLIGLLVLLKVWRAHRKIRGC